MDIHSQPLRPQETPEPVQEGGGKKGWQALGCLGCLGVFAGCIVLMGIMSYWALFYSSMPLRMLLGNGMAFNGKPVVFDGISGSISKGIRIEKVTVQDDPEDSVIEGLTFRYSGLWDSISNQQIIIEELSTERAVLIVDSNFLTLSKSDESDDDRDEGFSEAGNEGEGLSLFELRKLEFLETNLHSVDGTIEINIPVIRLTGLKIENNQFELSDFEIHSDCLDIDLVDAIPAQSNGTEIPFKRKLVGRIFPKIHPMVKREIDVAYEMGAIDGNMVARLTAFGGAFRHTNLPKGQVEIQFSDLTIGDYLDPKDAIVPEAWTMRVSQKDETVQIEEGNFQLGMAEFAIPKQTLDANSKQADLRAEAIILGEKTELIFHLQDDAFWPPYTVEIQSTKKLQPRQLIAQIYFQQPYAKLADEEKTRVDTLVKSIGPKGSKEQKNK